ncbi:hypothetical protein QNZ80_001905 [Vibrio parahaemolyticus]|nr:hypothetical protein [Vibrio parahaemolyticus]ELB2232100.1 hypothetical protein [Vibrio parahaemolyticus]
MLKLRWMFISVVLVLSFQKPIYLLKVSFVALSFQMSFLVLLGSIPLRCLLQVVSATNALKLRLN